MMTKKKFIGTSGWSYEHWKGVFYPADLPAASKLDFYSSQFSVVEINTTFYHMPSQKTVENWYATTPKHFTFAVKASRYITHLKRLKDCQDSIENFLERVGLLKEKLGPILFQLPPSFQRNDERLEAVLSQLPKSLKYVFEFRHASWEVQDVYDLLDRYKVGFCISDLGGKLSPLEVTGSFAYIRLHGPQKAYQGSYSDAQLKKWKERIEAWSSHKKNTYCFFDNDEKAYAIFDALRLKSLF